MPRIPLSPVTLTCVLFVACDQWPRHDFVPDIESEALPVGISARDQISSQVIWGELESERDPNDTPIAGDLLEIWNGRLISGRLDGWGWDPTASPERASSDPVNCPHNSNFPPLEATEDGAGDYAGDLDWISLRTPASNADSSGLQLCATVKLTIPAEVERPIFDLLLYNLDECPADEIRPLTPWHEPGTQGGGAGDPDTLLGYAQSGSIAEWGVQVPNDENLGIVLAGFSPADLSTLEVDWQMALSIVEIKGHGEETICPSMPEDTNR